MSKQTDQPGWLIESAHGDCLRRVSPLEWTWDPAEALRFARRQDAQQVLVDLGFFGAVHPVEYPEVPPPPSTPPPARQPSGATKEPSGSTGGVELSTSAVAGGGVGRPNIRPLLDAITRAETTRAAAELAAKSTIFAWDWEQIWSAYRALIEALAR